MASSYFQEVRLPVAGGALTLAGKLWSPVVASEPFKCALAYPGWLDNAGSFDAIAPLFAARGFLFLAIDPVGCGHSDHRAAHEIYNDFDEPVHLLDCLDALGWQTAVIVAHSRGGSVAGVFAGCFPERVRACVIFDSSLGLSGLYPDQHATTAPQRLQRAVTVARTNRRRQARVFASVDEAVRASVDNPFFPKAEHTARAIVRRHLTPCRDGWTFCHDVRTYGQNQHLHVDEAQMNEFIRAIAAPVLRVVASDSPFIDALPAAFKQRMERRLRCIRDHTEVVVSGRHHVHSDDAAAVAAVALRFLEQREEGKMSAGISATGPSGKAAMPMLVGSLGSPKAVVAAPGAALLAAPVAGKRAAKSRL